MHHRHVRLSTPHNISPYTVRYTGSMRIVLRLGILIVACYALPASAAQLYLNPDTTVNHHLDTFYVPLRIDTQGECINAVDVTIAYDPAVLSVRDVALGDSILTLWTQHPTIMMSDGRETGRVVLQGGIPGGYCGRVEGDPGQTNILAKFVVRGIRGPTTPEERVTTPIIIEPGSVVYRNDGDGTPAPLTMLGTELTFTYATGTPDDVWRRDIATDTTAPEYFDIRLVEGPSKGNQYHYIVFSTVDKQSGVDHYEVFETDPEQFGLLAWAERPSYWVRAESPYVLRDQHLHSKILVKAVDKKGNERIVEYTPPMSPLIAYTRASVVLPFATLIGILGIAGAIIVRLSRRRRGTTEQALRNDPSDTSHEV